MPDILERNEDLRLRSDRAKQASRETLENARRLVNKSQELRAKSLSLLQELNLHAVDKEEA